MAAEFRRFFSVALLCALLGVGGTFAAATSATAAPTAVGSGTPVSKPSSNIPGHQVRGEHFTKYCVKHYKPNSTVKVVNEKTGKVVYIHTNSKGAGCVEVPVVPGCQKIKAFGENSAGDPATSTATVCVLGKKVHRSSGALPFTGSNLIIPGLLLGLALIGAGTATTMVLRRRRGAPVAA